MGPPPAVATVRRAVRHSLAGLTDLTHPAEPADPADPADLPGPGPRPQRPRPPLVLVACSGGADSLALAAATAFEAPRAGLRAGAVTVDHNLQAGSAERAAALSDLLRTLGLDPVEVLVVAVGGQAGPEAAARTARYAALDAAAERHNAAAVLLGHSRDDQAETVLLGLARGSGARSLSGMPAVRGRYRRPLLGLDRATLRAACLATGLAPWDDPHNEDHRYTRSRVRGDALPALAAALGRRPQAVVAALARSAALLRDDADALDAWAEQAAAACDAGEGRLAVAPLAALPAAVRRRVLHRAALASGAPPARLTAAHLGELDGLLTGWHGQGPLHLPGGLAARRECGRLLIGRQAGEPGGRERA